MVQKKTPPDKLCVVPTETKKNYVKSDKRSTTHKPASTFSSSSSHQQDIRNKGGTDLKKKLKISRSLKLLDFQSLESSPVKEEKVNTTTTTTTQRSSAIKTSDNSPNYMKSTSSSNARKELSPVSSQTSIDSKSQKTRNSNSCKSSYSYSSPAGEKQAKNITNKNSLKPVRTLTKTSSIKAVKPFLKKSSGVASNQNYVNVGKATCSSTLKDSKFPDYLMINPGGTESEGTSVVKVCPYTYCSLNGHHHAPSPPLKCFMSVRRSSLRSLRLRCLSPVGTKHSAKTKKKIDTVKMDFDGESENLKANSTVAVISPQIEEMGMDFFVEIYYAKPRETIDGFVTGSDEKESPEAQDGAETELGNDENASKHMPNESSPYSEISLEDILDKDIDFPMSEMDISEHNQQLEVEEIEYPPYSVQVETDLECCSIGGTKSESIVLVQSEVDEPVSEAASEMEWEEEEVITELVSNGTNGDILCDAFEETIENLDADVVDSESYGDDDDDDDLMSEIDVSIGEGSSTEDSFEEQTAISEEKNDDTEPDKFNSSVISKYSVEDAYVEATAASEEKNGISEMENDFNQGNFLPGDHELPCSVEVINRNPEEEEEYQDDALTEQTFSLGNAEVGSQQSEPEGRSCKIVVDTFEAVNFKIDQDLAKSYITPDQSLTTADVGVGVGAGGKEQGDLDSGEEHNNESAQMHTQIEVSQYDLTQEDANCGTVTENLLPPTQEHSSDDQSSSSNMFENQELPAKNQGEEIDLSISSSTHAEEHNDPESYMLISAKPETVENIQVEDKEGTDAAETCLLAQNNAIGAEEKKKMMNVRRDFHQQATEKSSSNLKISIRRKKHNEDNEDLKEFNPREPNYLPVEPDPEAEKVDLRQQMIDERKNSEEWMLDYALRKTVNKLGPARKRRVALLVEAFETVTPQPKCESRIRNAMPTFSHTRPMQACI